MSASNELCFKSATELASEIRAGHISSRDVAQAHLSQIEDFNGRVKAIVTLDVEGTLKRALDADEAQVKGHKLGILHGLPIAHKDTFLTAGMRTTFGSPLFKDFVPTENNAVVEKSQ